MNLLLFNHRKLEERPSKRLKAWKVCHLILFSLAGVLGILNYVFLQNTMQLVDNNCVLYPRELAFRRMDMPNITVTTVDIPSTQTNVANVTENAQNVTVQSDINEKASTDKREVSNANETHNESDDKPSDVDTNGFPGNESQLIVLDTTRTLFGIDNCEFAEYMPLMSTIFAVAWATFFTMCPSGGHARSGLQQPWRILAPALLFALVMVGLTGHSFVITNGGLHSFCAAFHNVTNDTSCSSVSPHLELARNASWGMGGWATATGLCSAGVWTTWACITALFLARCLAAPDFKVHRTAVILNDPHKKIVPHIKKLRRRHQAESPTKRDNVSLRSEPTITTELVTASIEHDQETAPPSVQVTPVKRNEHKENIEMTTSPHNLHE